MDCQDKIVPPSANPPTSAQLAAQRDLEYHETPARWRALYWWQRLRTKTPEPPPGI